MVKRSLVKKRTSTFLISVCRVAVVHICLPLPRTSQNARRSMPVHLTFFCGFFSLKVGFSSDIRLQGGSGPVVIALSQLAVLLVVFLALLRESSCFPIKKQFCYVSFVEVGNIEFFIWGICYSSHAVPYFFSLWFIGKLFFFCPISQNFQDLISGFSVQSSVTFSSFCILSMLQ